MRALIADDDPVSRRVLQAALKKWGYEVIVTRNGQEAWDVLRQEDGPHLAILDWMMPDIDGIEVCRRMRSCSGDYTYIVLLTARGRKEDILEGMDAGADDYITKPFDLRELKVRLHAAERILNLQAELIAAGEALREQATHDDLTGLWNRSATLDILDRELHRSRRKGTSIAVVMTDLDHFKQINDTFGHEAGDIVLAQVGKRMSAVVRPYDSIGRYGGEEFLIVLPGCDVTGAVATAERLRRVLVAEDIVVGGDCVRVTASFGVMTVCADDSTTADALVHAADEAMYQAKRNGRNRVEVSSQVVLLKMS